MNLYKGTYYTAGILSITGIILVALITNGNIGQIGILLYVAYIILALIISSVLYFTIKNISSNKALLVSTSKVVGIFLVTALICYFALSTGEETPLRDGNILSESGSRLVSAGLFMFYALMVAATCIMIFFGVKNMKK
ncbi:MAG: hypothetical protein OR998_00995 [Flavobacteriaceae bacterium]|jgi:hypothetical protein|nr:hypothetical protein [Flavobacteriaceae bacterium]CAI8279887.1 MAG: Uncharacterised protein [Flavobacteriaceae bacterium]|tara:strand:- start:2858 stop:3271 length:414 start_codon:yes stop_codon:yes gene_type:complete